MRTSVAVKKGVIAGFAISAMIITAVTFGLLNRSADANTVITGPRDCDNNAVMHCGALSTN